MLGGLQATMHTMGCVHGSSNEILSEWDPGPIYVVQRLWDPGEPNYTSRSFLSVVDLEKLGLLKSYIDYIHLQELSSHPSLVVPMLILFPKLHLGKLDCMGIFRYLGRPIGLDNYLETVVIPGAVHLS